MSFAHLGNVSEIEELYKRYLADPKSVDPSWGYFFQGMGFVRGEITSKASKIERLIQTFRESGHLFARINPLSDQKERFPLSTLGFKESELPELFPTLKLLPVEEAPLKKIIETLEEIYCGTVGFEYMGTTPELEAFIQKAIEPGRSKPNFSHEKKREILKRLNRATLFEIFLHTKYVGQKRFSLEGCETLIPLLQEIIETGSKLGVEEVVMGMSHRGRLNVLTNLLNKTYSMVFGEFEDSIDPNLLGTGDVKYHKGYSSTVSINERDIHLSLTPNASHLESVDPIVEGKTRARQLLQNDLKREKILPILIHGDGAIAGQGVVYECLQLYKLKGYTTGGTLHLVLNNQIGFTTIPKEARSTRYCTDIAKAFGAPVFHLNVEDPEGALFAASLALEIRQKFHTDVFLELNGYRKYGHNEGDEPAFTQPVEYKKIRSKQPIRKIYEERLMNESLIEKKMVEEAEQAFQKELHDALSKIDIHEEKTGERPFEGEWEGFQKGDPFEDVKTGVSKEALRSVAQALAIPDGFEIHPKVEKVWLDRKKMGDGELPFDWAGAEQFAIGTLLLEGTEVRLSGQDSRRGTFSQRHACVIDQSTSGEFIPFATLPGVFEVINSPLSEFGVLGFEFGYSLANPNALVMWEAQYGDFANGAQVIIDQYIAASEQKWQRFSGLVLLLPHGYEGQGPEHSSARLERFLQLAGHNNIQVVYPTTPSQIFHLLRRQAKRDFRRPLIVMSPKGLLRHPKVLSPIEALVEGRFEEILVDQNLNAKRVLVTTGRLYYDLLQERERRGLKEVAIVRIEQLYPLDETRLKELLEKYGKMEELFWVQEEPKNMGAWFYIIPKLSKIREVEALGRERSASVAVGSHAMHIQEMKELMERVFRGAT